MMRLLFALVLAVSLAACAKLLPRDLPVAYAAYGDGLPTLPLPLPEPSARRNVPAASFGTPKTMGDIERRLRFRLEQRGYEDSAYYRVRDGFALITAMERIHADGRAFAAPQRFAVEAKALCKLRFAFQSLLDCLLEADPGRYRAIVFVVTTAPVTTDGSPASIAEIENLLDKGGDFLPLTLALEPFTAEHNVSANVYEFARPAVSAKPVQVTNLSARQHLSAAGILN